MTRFKRGISGLLAALIFFASSFMTAGAATEPNPVWPQYRGDSRLLGVTDAKTPVSADQTVEKWKADLNDGWADPSVVLLDDSLYTVYGNMMSGSCYLQKRSVSDGSVQKQTQLIENIGFFPFITYGDGKLFVSVDDGRIEAFDANTLAPLWVSQTLYDVIGDDADGQQSLAPIIYNNGYVYTGSTYGNASTGMYYCLSADCNEVAPSDLDEWKDEITSDGLKVNRFQWTYVPDTGKKGFYWGGGAVTGNAIVFGGDNGELVSHSLTKDTVFDKIDLNSSGYSKDDDSSAIRSTAFYDKATGRVLVSSKEDCTISSLAVKPDGTFNHASLIQKQITNAGNITSSPIVYNGRLYIGSGGMGAGSEFSVLDANTLDIIYQVPIQTQSTPVLTTAYATAENHNTVYLYVAWYDQDATDGLSDCIFCIKDYEGNTQPDCTKLITPSINQCNTCTLALGNDGTIYYKNDSGTLFAFANENGGAYTTQDVINAINRIPPVNSLTTDDEVLVERAQNRYDGLSKADQSAVTNYAILTAASAKITQLKDMPNIISRLTAAIDALPDTITLDQQQTVYSLLNTYNSLPDQFKSSVNNAQKLLNAKTALDEISDNQTVAAVIGAINTLPSDIHYDSKGAVYAAYGKYTALSTTLQRRVSNASALLQKKAAVDSVVTAVDSLNSDIWNKVNPSKISYSDKETVNELISRYNALDSYDRQFVQYYQDVLDAKKAIDGTEATVQAAEINDGYQVSLNKQSITASTVSVALGNITVSFPDTMLNTLTKNGAVQLNHSPLSQTVLTGIGGQLGSGTVVVDSFGFGLTDTDGKPMNSLGGTVPVTVKLTDDLLAQLSGAKNTRLYSYDPDTGKLENTNAVFDLQKKTATFSANHFGSYVIVREAAASPTTTDNQTTNSTTTAADIATTTTAADTTTGTTMTAGQAAPTSTTAQQNISSNPSTANPSTGDSGENIPFLLLLAFVPVILFMSKNHKNLKNQNERPRT